MKIELFKIVAAVEALTALEQINKIPFSLAWQIDDLKQIFQIHYDRFNVEKNNIVQEFGIETDENIFEIRKENRTEFDIKIKGLLDLIIELNGLELLKKAELLDASLKVNEKANIAALKPFIV